MTDKELIQLMNAPNVYFKTEGKNKLRGCGCEVCKRIEREDDIRQRHARRRSRVRSGIIIAACIIYVLAFILIVRKFSGS
jgi:hypothetical protein